MEYTDLNRSFVPIKKDEERNFDIGRYWGKRLGSWIDWEALLKRKRVVILAEASSGKTAEFNYAVKMLQNMGKAAFFIPIEDLADDGFEKSLNSNEFSRFESWLQGLDDGYFFLDSIDEARLNRKKFDKALSKFANEVSNSLPRCRIFISCRVTDWKGVEDIQTIQERLPFPKTSNLPIPEIDPESALLAPLFEDQKTKNQNTEAEQSIDQNEIAIVRLAPLDNEQQRLLAQANNVLEIDKFCHAIWKNGLENLAERPGDLLELAHYWKSYQKFGSLSEMTEHAISKKLQELNRDRADNGVLSNQKAKEGAERIAAALTLGKTFTLQAPDSEIASDVLNPIKLLPDWTDAERNALLRRGIFAPATYGRVRFHHRSTQEYLTAQWLKHLLQQGCPRSEIFSLLFAEVYNVQTVVPSLKPIAAWLALSEDDIRDEIINTDPLLLIQHGDPGSIAVITRCKLLLAYAERQKTGDIANDILDHRALWMFAHQDLADTIRKVWYHCDLLYFRGDLIRLIQEGAIAGCCDLLQNVVEDPKANKYQRINALQALINCEVTEPLPTIASELIKDASTNNASLTANFAVLLFPNFLNIEQILTLIHCTSPPKRNESDGFGNKIYEIWEKCPIDSRNLFIGNLADLALSKPLCEFRRISEKFGYLANELENIAHEAITDLGDFEPTKELLRLLMAIEHAHDSYSPPDLQPTLGELVQSSPKVHQQLFWANVADKRELEGDTDQTITYWEYYSDNRQLCSLNNNDLPWLYQDLQHRNFLTDKRIALHAIVSILNRENTFDKEKVALFDYTKDFATLTEDLENYCKPLLETDKLRNYRLQLKQNQHKRQIEENNDKKSWLKFRNELISDPNQLSSSAKRFNCIHFLIVWLKNKTALEASACVLNWPSLTEAFNQEIAFAFRDAMKAHWRETKPERPKREGNTSWPKRNTVYAYAGIGLEANDDSKWATHLTETEAKCAAQHGCLSEQGYPIWLDDLVIAHPSVVIPVIVKAFRMEWSGSEYGSNDLLFHYADSDTPSPKLLGKLFQIMTLNKPGTIRRLDCGLSIFLKMSLTKNQNISLKNRAVSQFEHYLAQNDDQFAIRYLVLLFQVDPTCAFQKLTSWIQSAKPEVQNILAANIIGGIFNRHDIWLVSDSLKIAPLETLKDLLLLAYREIHPSSDNQHDGVFSPNERDQAESGRNAILSLILNLNGVDAYQALLDLAEAPEIGSSKHRFRQLAREIAERDAEFSAWTENETLVFVNKHIIPIKNGEALYQCVLNVLDDIRHGFRHNDASSLRLLSKLAEIEKDEKSVQNWLAEQLSLRANGRYHVHREAEVANHNMPDIIISGTSGVFEIAIEVKQADSWSPKELKQALTKQLAEDYLKPQTRRYGILFLTDHGRRKWNHPTSRNKSFSFTDLQAYLAGMATDLKQNATGNIRVAVFGVDGKIS